jgi:hypothetical protein
MKFVLALLSILLVGVILSKIAQFIGNEILGISKLFKMLTLACKKVIKRLLP